MTLSHGEADPSGDGACVWACRLVDRPKQPSAGAPAGLGRCRMASPASHKRTRFPTRLSRVIETADRWTVPQSRLVKRVRPASGDTARIRGRLRNNGAAAELIRHNADPDLKDAEVDNAATLAVNA